MPIAAVTRPWPRGQPCTDAERVAQMTLLHEADPGHHALDNALYDAAGCVRVSTMPGN
jgi:hypothetical protein